jgi:8-amino-7-oxononanoate synthase
MNRIPKKLKDKLDKRKQDNGFGVYPILTPTVPKGEKRLRFCLHSINTREEIGNVLQVLKSYL